MGVLCQMCLLFSLLMILALTARGMNVSLEPEDATVFEGEWASFNCSIECEFRTTHTLRWLVGDSLRIQRSVYLSRNGIKEREFMAITGYQVILEDRTNCNSAHEGQVTQILRINATSVGKVNKTAIQCAAFRETVDGFDFLSYYAVLLVKANNTVSPSQPLPSPSTCVATTKTVTVAPPVAPGIAPSACPQNITTVSQSPTVSTTTRVVTQTVTVTHVIVNPTNLPIGSGNSSAPSLMRSMKWTIYLMSLILALFHLSLH